MIFPQTVKSCPFKAIKSPRSLFPALRYTVLVYVCRSLIVSFGMILLACPMLAADRPILVCFGDSITAGYGLETGQSFPDALQRDLDHRGYRYKVINQGTSGATTKDAVAALRTILLLHPQIV